MKSLLLLLETGFFEFFLLCRWLSGHNPISLLLLLLLHQLADSISSSSSSFAREVFGGAASALSGTLWNSMSPRLAMGARVCVSGLNAKVPVYNGGSCNTTSVV